MNDNQWNDIYKKGGKHYAYYDIIGEPHADMDKVLATFRKAGVKKILDLGCGAGRNTWYAAARGFDVFGLDLAGDGIKILKKFLAKKGLKASLTIGDIFEPLPYPDHCFDAIVSVQVLQHGTEGQIIGAIKEIERVLKPGGMVFITLCGRISKGKVRHCLVKTAKKIAPNTYVPTIGSEVGLTHFIYNKGLIAKHYEHFKMLDMWRDDKDYYAFIGKAQKTGGK